MPCHLHHFFMLVLHQTNIQCGDARTLPMVCEGPSLCHNIGAGSDASSRNPMDHPAHDHSHSSHIVFDYWPKETSSMTHCIVTVFSSSDPLQTHKICLIVNIILQVLLACLRALQKGPKAEINFEHILRKCDFFQKWVIIVNGQLKMNMKFTEFEPWFLGTEILGFHWRTWSELKKLQ